MLTAPRAAPARSHSGSLDFDRSTAKLEQNPRPRNSRRSSEFAWLPPPAGIQRSGSGTLLNAERTHVRTGAHSGIHAAAVMAPARSSKELLQQYRDIMDVPLPVMERVRDDFVNQMAAGLAAEGGSSLPMLPTRVDILPDGHEKGEYYSIDLGGSHIRVMYVKLSKQHGQVDALRFEENDIPDKYRQCPADELFDWMAETLLTFAETQGWDTKKKRKMVLGFCFSFPVEQTARDVGTLIKWVKGFDNADAVGQDVVQLLRDAFQRKGVRVEIPALVNDTVGTLACARYGDGMHQTDTNISIIVGTGTNCCYVDQLSRIGKFHLDHLPRTSDMIVNTEWADYTSEALPRLQEDEELDAESHVPGQHHFEKMTSGLYMGDLARRIILRLAEDGGLFDGDVPEHLQERKALSTIQMETIHKDATDDLAHVAGVLQEEFGIEPDTLPIDVRSQVQEVCALVAVRGARLTAAAVAGILRHLGCDDKAHQAKRNVVAVEGAVVRNYDLYREAVQTGLLDLLGEGTIFVDPAPPLSGTLGAALVSAAASGYMKGLSYTDY